MAKNKDYNKYFLKAVAKAIESERGEESQSETESEEDVVYGKKVYLGMLTILYFHRLYLKLIVTVSISFILAESGSPIKKESLDAAQSDLK